MELSQIRNFLYLAKTLNFTEAAHLSGISQPSLTRSIKRLEDELGGSLVHRDGKDTRLTPLGRDVQAEFMGMLKIEERVRVLAETSVHGKRETLTIGLASTLSPGVIGGFLNHVVKELPSVELIIRPLTHMSGLDEVLAGEIDACFLAGGPDSHPKLSIVELFSEKLKLCCAMNHRFAAMDDIPASELATEMYVDRLSCEFRSDVIEQLMDNNVLMQPRIRSDREDLAQHIVARGEGICMLPEFSSIVPGLTLKCVPELDLSRRVRFVAVSGASYAMALRQMWLMAERFDWNQSLHALKL